MPGWDEAGPGTSLQQAVALAGFPPSVSASSKVTSRSPSFLNAGELVIMGTQVWRKASTLVRPESLPCWLTQGASWPSLQRLGVMKLKSGVVDMDLRSVARPGHARRDAGGEGAGGRAQRHHVGLAQRGVVDDGVEVDERVVAGGVAVAGDGPLGQVR